MASPASRCVLLDPGVPDYVFSIGPTEQGWASIDLKKKRYQGCGRYGPLLAESVKLYVRLAEEHPALSRLAICADKNIIRNIVAEELKKKKASKAAESSSPGLMVPDLAIRAIEFDKIDEISGVTARVEVADKNLMVLSLSFVFTSSKHYLLYDAIHASMSMIPIPNWCCDIYLPSNPLPVRYGDEYALVLFAKNYPYKREGRSTCIDLLYLWTPPKSSSPPTLLPPPPPPPREKMYPNPSGEPWHTRKPRFSKETPASFCHHVKFTSSSHAFWADLTKGVLCCRIKDLLDSFFVHFDFIELPPGCKSDALDDSDTGPAEMFRTMGCSTGDLIKFVSISFDDSVPEDDKTVTEWTLDMGTLQWTKGEELRFGTLWELDDFKKDGLPETEPVYPLLSMEEGDGGDLYFILSRPIMRWEDPAVHHVCRFNMTSKKLVSNPLSWRPDKIVPSGLLGCEFFRHLDSQRLVPDNRKMDAGKVQSWVEMESALEEVDESMQREISRKQMVWSGSQLDLFCQAN
ncbi:uncharacterized protein [Oryza sativa Japonica Group]|uniref:Expressed protein n=2 Tax=Oryza sativa subsp. japonica TaxID=39947 RepID=Q8LLN5_ORYSJ|nr:uncharacterized protein LOC4334142 [Oryza sativa Japonica Group]KAB8093617.1 hypothetical protein EE612_020488 [Oryza sativa]AAM34395.2 unknown protein [Oryza sativa Japonica Group]AAP68355.1 unknown protein [Oryza sativa Japonica Group]ABF98929.1 expressed protein [Oryza sativa Japonica Group]ABF98930.1 expressed protein [Oryza sativa Japonica Group]|eukprot:NP_001051302.1 Os03g0753500 [Oryza sativa Japonica Group]